MKKLKNRIYRKYQDFYTEKDLRNDFTMPPINITIADFNAKGHIENPRAPCVVTLIDPHYIKDARTQRLTKKFRMKTDILQLREITRKKFMIYATQEMHLEKQRQAEFEEYVYRRIIRFHEFAEESLKKIEAQVFKDLKAAQAELSKLKDVKLKEELNEIMAKHQSVLVEVRELYGRFLYLLKLISYFDEIVIEEIKDSNNPDRTKLIKLPEITDLEITNKTSGRVEIQRIRDYMENIVRPYLAQRHHLNADIWYKGYEHTRNKISNYNRRYTNLALLNHIMGIVFEKFQKTYARCTIKPIFLKNPNFMRKRAEELKESAQKVINDLEIRYKQDKVYLELNAIVPVILETLEPKTKKEDKTEKGAKTKKSIKRNQIKPEGNQALDKDEDDKLLTKIEKIQVHVLSLLNQLDSMPPDIVKKAERTVRRRMNLEKEMSRRALEKQNRMHNWREHMKRHELERAKDTKVVIKGRRTELSERIEN